MSRRGFVGWWDGTIRRKGGKGGYRNLSAEISLSVSEAEKQTKISDGEVSRWRKRLVNKKKSLVVAQSYYIARNCTLAKNNNRLSSKL